MPTSNNKRIKFVLFLLFTVSGFSGLIYESIWSHYLKLMLGHAAYAQTLVLAIFMGGMALGAWITGRKSEGCANPLLGYAIIEGIIGLLGLVFHQVFSYMLDWLFVGVIPVLGEPAITITKWCIASCLILPQSILLGMTFPLISAAVVRLAPEESGSALSLLYFTNSIGAAIGVLISGFVLIELVGLPGTILTAALLNMALAIIVYGLAKRRVDASLAANTAPHIDSRKNTPVLLVSAALFTGMASFFYEIGWIRMLSMVLGSTNQAFELMLSAFITGLALGAFWLRHRIDRIKLPLRFAAYVQMLMGILALLTIPLYNYTFDFMSFLLESLQRNDGGYLLFNFGSHAIALAVMLPATFAAGMTLPLFTNVLIRHGSGERSIGRIYAANTVGAIIGVLAAVHLLLPNVGTKGLLSAGAAIDLGLGWLLLGVAVPNTRRRELPICATVTSVIFISIVAAVPLDIRKMAGGVFRGGKASTDGVVEYHRDGKTASISLIRFPGNAVSITTNGKPDAAVNMEGAQASVDEVTMTMAAALPLSIHKEARRVANIGFGSGMTTHALLGVDTVEMVDTVEIEPFVVEAARGFGKFVERAYTDNRSHIYFEDAKTFFSSQKHKYDIIISEPSNPWVSGVASLFSQEFYQRITQYLEKDGLLVQWVQLYEINLEQVASVFNALSKSFSDYVVFNTDDSNILIVASNGKNLHTLDGWIFEEKNLAKMLTRVELQKVEDLSIRKIGSKAFLQPFFSEINIRVNSDYFPYLSHEAPKSRFLKETVVALGSLKEMGIPIQDMLDSNIVRKELATQSRDFRESRMQRLGKEVLDNVTSGGEANISFVPVGSQIPTPEAMTGYTLTTTSEKMLRRNMLLLAQAVNSRLPKEDLEEMWDYLFSRLSFDTLSPWTQDWLRLHRAGAQRNGPDMYKYATDLLERDNIAHSDAELDYIVTAGLTGALKGIDKITAESFLEKHYTKFSKGSKIPPVLSLLTSHLY